jgi:hypothetical protein
MKIGMMSLWNAANGPSVHAEFLGRAWVNLGHQLRIFSATRHPDARPTQQKDEDYVIRHFKVDSVNPFTRAAIFDPYPLLEEEYDVFVAQNVERLPAEKLLQLFPTLKKKAVTVQVVHEGKAPDDPLYYKFNWDAIVCFDNRYREYLVRSFPKERIHTIPYPCHPYKPGDKLEARIKLGLPEDRNIVFSFGFRPKDIAAVLPALSDLAQKYPLTYVIVANPDSDVTLLQEAKKKYDFIDLQVRPLPLDELYTYLHASDARLVHRESSTKYFAVLSSSVCQTLGSGCPILFHNSNFVETHGDEVIKYEDLEDLKAKLTEILQGNFNTKRLEEFLRERNADTIAKKYIQLFEELLRNQ